MGLDVLERKTRHIGDVVKGWKVLSIDSKTMKGIIQCENCGMIKEVAKTAVSISAEYQVINSNTKTHSMIVTPCLCSGLSYFNNEPVVYTTEGQKQVLDMLKENKTYTEIGNTLGVTRQSVGNTVKSMRNNYLKYLKQLEKSNEIKANRE